jgi:prophage maintenance system killer protein
VPNRVTLIGDLLLAAEAQLATPAEELLRTTSLDSDPAFAALLASFDEADSSPTLVEEAAMCAAWVVRRQPFPKDNRQIGYRFMCSLLDEAGLPWTMSREDVYVVVSVFKSLEAGTINEAEFVDWVCLRVARGERLREEATA